MGKGFSLQTEVLSAGDPQSIPRAIGVLHAGGLVAFPTDTVYGLAALAFDSLGIERLYQVKDRETTKAIAILLSSADELPHVTGEMTPIARRLADRFWPGPLTLVVPTHPALPANLSPRPTIGVRMPAHPLALALLRQAGPLATTSANLSGHQSACTAQEVLSHLAGRIALILDGGRTPGGLSSTVVDCTGLKPVILRSGPISLADLQSALAE